MYNSELISKFSFIKIIMNLLLKKDLLIELLSFKATILKEGIKTIYSTHHIQKSNFHKHIEKLVSNYKREFKIYESK